MKEIEIRKALSEGRTVLNGWSVIPGGFLAEVMASLGWDALTIDMQHGMISETDMLGMLQAISTTKVTPMVRLGANTPELVGKALDAGAMGVICPLINTPEDASRFVSACRYPPLGVRSSGATRAMIYAGFDYGAHADDQVLKLAMIETRDALENLSLAQGGKQGFDLDEPNMLDAYKAIAAACKKHGLTAGIHTASPEFAARMQAIGFRFITLVGDFNFILAGRGQVGAARKLLGD